jgi:hypothetical protein
MVVDVGLAAASITGALISSGAVSVKDQTTEATVKQAANLYGMVLTELIYRERQDKLYKQS